jgi:tetratricopeptide (TPR) repeat protein
MTQLPPGPLLTKSRSSGTLGQAAVASLGRARGERLVVQDFCPFPQSREWELGQAYLREKGSQAFLRDVAPVPHVVNNDGNLSLAGAQLLFTALREAEQEEKLEDEIRVLELGVGVGLFARLFLDAFRALCRQHAADYYDRLVYVAGDYSDRMLRDAGRHGTFAGHPGRYLLRVVDALNPVEGLGQDRTGRDWPPYRAVFLNYLLDCLPAAVLEDAPEGPRQLCVRTCLARGLDPERDTPFGLDGLLARAQSTDPAARRELLAVFPLLAADYAFRPVDLASVPHAEFALAFAKSEEISQVVHSYGAIQCLDQLLPLLHRQGFILVNDYGQVDTSEGAGFEHQRFSGSTFVGLNFPLLRAYFTQAGPGGGSVLIRDQTSDVSKTSEVFSHQGGWAEPAEEEASIHARLVGRDLPAGVVARFQELFGKAATDEVQGPARLARALAEAGRVEAAATAYHQAVERQPCNWLLLGEVARFVTFALHSPASGVALARQALALNPACSADLWNTLGDALFALGRIEEARRAFQKALRINPHDVRAHYNLAFVHCQRQEWDQALQAIARGLALDGAGQHREGLLQKQAEGENGVRYYEDRPGVNGLLHGTSSVKESHFIS